MTLLTDAGLFADICSYWVFERRPRTLYLPNAIRYARDRTIAGADGNRSIAFPVSAAALAPQGPIGKGRTCANSSDLAGGVPQPWLSCRPRSVAGMAELWSGRLLHQPDRSLGVDATVVKGAPRNDPGNLPFAALLQRHQIGERRHPARHDDRNADRLR